MTLPAFKVFLSHRYKSPETNLFFFNLFARHAELQFEVDEGVTFMQAAGGLVQSVPTNVTRLERMVRGADAFVGIYPLSLPATEAATREQLINESRYFRLELDLAIRAGKPALVLYDQRYRSMFEGPSSVFRSSFDAQEILPGQQSPNAASFSTTFANFCASVSASMAFSATRGAVARSSRVGVLLPPSRSGGQGYEADKVDLISRALGDNNFQAEILHWPPRLDRGLLTGVSDFDFLIVDMGDDPVSAAAVAFLHGRFMPALRLLRQAPGEPATSRLEESLYGSITAGYPKDVLRWSTPEELDEGIRSRLQVIDLPARRIATRTQSEEYFGRSAKKPVNVFLSYCGRDETVASRISAALSRRFHKVFDYKDGKSIRAGEPWLREIFDQLAEAAVAVPLISDDYFASGNCEHEAREIIARRDNQKLHVIPVKVKPKVVVPTWFADIQSERTFVVNDDADELAQKIVQLVEERARGGGPVAGVTT